MKTLLVPIDFSEASYNALNYAAELAKKANLEILLLNVFVYPMVATDPVVWIPSNKELIEEYLEQLKNIRTNIRKEYGKTLQVECYCEAGGVIETINAFVVRHKADMIVMGLQGGGFVSEKIIGSTTASLMRKSACPVLGIPFHAQFKPIRQIVFATDHQDAEYGNLLQPLREFIRIFDAHLFVLHVIDPAEGAKKERLNHTLELALKGIPFTVHTSVHPDVAAAIDQFTEDKAVDITVIIPRKHSFFYSFFHEANTKKLVFHTEIPVLALHE